ncbi:MAG TPA: nuclear transport factor 2 family protein [Acidimicrobiia bacterium]|nr:nuclear transport factor 2 family protein [Acidimicrobiia bacterium]
MIDPAALTDLLGKWWFNYDEGDFDVLTTLLTEDVHFTCRTDTDTVAWAEFARADARGRDTVMFWQKEHRRNSPYPLRHNGSNAHIVEQRGTEAAFASYIHVTQIVNEMPVPIPGGVVRGVVRDEGGVLRIAELHVVLDAMTSDVFSNVKA